MVHPAYSQAWKNFDLIHGDFARDSSNIRLSLSTDGFTPFGIGGPSYSCWHVFITPYNLPLSMITQPQYTFLTLLISGPEHPVKKIDVFLHALIDELKSLWSERVHTFDSFYKENFQMRVSMM
jgi:Transposase family tnp2